VLLFCNFGFALCSALLIVITRTEPRDVNAIYAVLVMLGVVRAFNSQRGERCFLNSCRLKSFLMRSHGTPQFFREQPFSGLRWADSSTRCWAAQRVFTPQA